MFIWRVVVLTLTKMTIREDEMATDKVEEMLSLTVGKDSGRLITDNYSYNTRNI